MSRWRYSVWKVRASAAENYARRTLARPWRHVGRSVASVTNVEGSGSSWAVRLCGPLSVRAGGRDVSAEIPGRQGRLLLAYLVLNRERACPRAELLDVLWPELPPSAPDAALSALLSKLRKALGAGALRGRSELRLEPGAPVWVDVEAAATGARRAEACAQDGDWAAAAEAAQAALDACAGDLLPDQHGAWLHQQRAELASVAGPRARGPRRRRAAGRRARHRGRGRAGGDRARAVPRVRAPPADGGARGRGQPRRGAARVRGPARGCCARSSGRRPGRTRWRVHERVLLGRPPARPRPRRRGPGRGRRWPAPLDAIRAAGTRSSAARPRPRRSQGTLARARPAGAVASPCSAAMPASARRGSRPSSLR